MASTKTATASKAATSKTTSKTASKKAAPSANSDAKVKKSTKKTDTGIKKAPSLYNTYFKANYALVKEENPELEPKEMMAKMGELWRLEPSNPKSENYDGPPVTKKAKK